MVNRILVPTSSWKSLVYIIFVCFFLPKFSTGQSHSPPPSEIILTDLDRGYIILNDLCMALNAPQDLVLVDALSRNVALDQRDALRSRFKEIAKAIDSAGFVTKSTELKYTFSIDSISRDKNLVSLHVDFCAETKGYLFCRNIVAQMSGKTIHEFELVNSGAVLESLKGYVEEIIVVAKDFKKDDPVVQQNAAVSAFDLTSNNLFKPQMIFSNYTRFTTTVAQVEFDGLMFSRPYDVVSVVYDDIGDEFDRNYLMVTDPNWNRVVASEDKEAWIHPYGEYGSGDDQFNNPVGIDFTTYGWRWVVADANNNRIQVFSLDYTNSFSLIQTLTNNFISLSDVAVRSEPSHPVYWLEYAALDWGRSEVQLFDGTGTHKSTFFSQGSGFEQLYHPTSICYDRNSVDGDKEYGFYVADNGNNRVVYKHPSFATSFKHTAVGTFPENANLTSISVDAFGYPHVVDQTSGTIYLLFPDLSGIIATYGSKGVLDNQLLYPNCISFVQKFVWDVATSSTLPAQIGEAMVTEQYGQQSGIRRLVQGNDVLNSEVTYLPQPAPDWEDYVRCDWHQSGYTQSWRKLYYGTDPETGYLIDEVYNSFNFPGNNSYKFDLFNYGAPNGNYTFEIRVQSLFNPSLDTTFTETILVNRFVSPCVPQINLITKGWNIHRVEDQPSNSTCLYKDNDQWWKISAALTAGLCDTTLYFSWTGREFSRDTNQSVGVDGLVTTFEPPFPDPFVVEAYFRLRELPFGYQYGDVMPICSLMVTSVADTPYVEGYPFLDTLVMNWSSVYESHCVSPCTTCYVPPSCPVVYLKDGAGYRMINNILPECESLDSIPYSIVDWIPIMSTPETPRGIIKLMLKEDDGEVSTIDELALYSLFIPGTIDDLRLGSQLSPLKLSGDSVKSVSAFSNTGDDVLALIQHQDSLRFQSFVPGYIDLEYTFGRVGLSKSAVIGEEGGVPIDPPPKNQLKINAQDTSAFTPNVYAVYAMNSNNEYELVEKIYPRKNWVPRVVELTNYVIDNKLKIRLAWSVQISINSLPYLKYDRLNIIPVRRILSYASHSVDGNITNLLNSAGVGSTRLRPGQQLDLMYLRDPAPDSVTEIMLLKVVGSYYTLGKDNQSQNGPLPESFSLEQNYPNPFNLSTTIKFGIPEATHAQTSPRKSMASSQPEFTRTHKRVAIINKSLRSVIELLI